MKEFIKFSGRLNRARFIRNIVIILLPANILFYIIHSLAKRGVLYSELPLFITCVVLWILLFILYIFQTIKRIHDTDRPGGFFLVLLIPLINLYAMYIVLFEQGTQGANEYGENPLKI